MEGSEVVAADRAGPQPQACTPQLLQLVRVGVGEKVVEHLPVSGSQDSERVGGHSASVSQDAE